MFIGTLARKNEKLKRFWHVGKQTCWHIDHVSTYDRMGHDLANSQRTIQRIKYRNNFSQFSMRYLGAVQ